MSIRDAREALLKLTRKGVDCPVCGKLAKVYRRKISSTMAYYLIQFAKHGAAHSYVDTPAITGGDHAAETARFVLWGILEPQRDRRGDGGPSGRYRLTPLGVDFVEGRARVRKYVHVYNDQVIERSGEMISIQDALGDKFDYAELMK